MRVAVLVALLGQERVGGREFFQDGDVGHRGFFGGEILDRFERGKTDQIRGNFPVVEITAVAADRAIDLEAVFEAGLIILHAVTGGGVHAAGAAVGRHVIREHDHRCAIDEWMTSREFLERLACERFDDRRRCFDLGNG